MAETSATMSGLSDEEHRRQLRRALLASTVGTTIEWYDFLLYGTVTGLVFSKVFFPDRDPIDRRPSGIWGYSSSASSGGR